MGRIGKGIKREEGERWEREGVRKGRYACQIYKHRDV